MTYSITVQGETDVGDFDSRLLFPETFGRKFSDSFLKYYDEATHTYGVAYVSYHQNGADYRLVVAGHLTQGAHHDIGGEINEVDLQKVVNGKFVMIGQMAIGSSDTPGTVNVPIQSLAALTPDILLKDTETLGAAKLYLAGRTGNDKLYGDAAGDLFWGQEGNDVFTGYGGKDQFVFALIGKANADHITDFTHGQDKILIDLSDGDPFGDITSNSHIKQIFHDITNSAEDKNDRIIYDRHTGVLSFDDDGSGNDKAVVFGHLDNHAKLDYHDFEIWS